MKKLIPYLTTVAIFCFLFVLTQQIDTEIWYIGFDQDSGSVVNNHKTKIQIKIFVYGLALWLALLNFLPIVNTNFPKLQSRMLCNTLTIAVIYSVNYYLSRIIDSGGFNIYYDWRSNMGVPLAIGTIIISTLLNWIVYHLGINRITGYWKK